MKILVLGGSGFLGINVCNELISKGHVVTVLDKKPLIINSNKIKYFKVDLRNIKKINKFFKSQDHLINLAGLADINQTFDKPIETIQENLLVMVESYLLAAKFKLKSYMFASTVYVNSSYGNFYKASKLSCEEYLVELNKKYKLPFKILRYGSLYGPGSDEKNGIYRIIKNIIFKKKVILEGPKVSTRSYIHVIDAAKATVDMLQNKFNNLKINITGREQITYEKLGNLLKEIFNIKKKITFNEKILNNHYKLSPYNFKSDFSMKYSPNYSIELEEGLIKLARNIENQ
jgi:UDP-glucose 4-epimerase